jgi:peptidoglycan-N-acetylglucosamine deacetylase
MVRLSRVFEGTVAALAAILICGIAGRSFAQNGSTTSPDTQRTLAVTVDDLPGAVPGTDHNLGDLKELEKINREITATLRAHHAPAIGFVNEWKLQATGERDARAALLEMWVDAGLDLGNHTYTHKDFNQTPIEEFEDEVIRDEVVSSALLAAKGRRETFFRHPFLNTGATAEDKAALEAFLARRGYKIAPVTVDASDYAFNDVLGAAHDKRDRKLADKTKKAYLDYNDTVFAYYEGAAQKLFGRGIPQVLLIHDSELNRECLDALLTKLEHRGYRFVSLEAAMSDSAYATPDNFVGNVGISWIPRWRVAKGLKPDYEDAPDPPKWMMKEFNEIRNAHAQQ